MIRFESECEDLLLLLRSVHTFQNLFSIVKGRSREVSRNPALMTFQ